MQKDYKMLCCTTAGQHRRKRTTNKSCMLLPQQESLCTINKYAKRLAHARKSRCTQAEHDLAKLPKVITDISNALRVVADVVACETLHNAPAWPPLRLAQRPNCVLLFTLLRDRSA